MIALEISPPSALISMIFNKDGGLSSQDVFTVYGAFDINLYDGSTRVQAYKKITEGKVVCG